MHRIVLDVNVQRIKVTLPHQALRPGRPLRTQATRRTNLTLRPLRTQATRRTNLALRPLRTQATRRTNLALRPLRTQATRRTNLALGILRHPFLQQAPNRYCQRATNSRHTRPRSRRVLAWSHP